MQCSQCINASYRLACRPMSGSIRRAGRCQSQSGRAEPFNEGAVQVKRLVNRDRKELLGNKVDILDKYVTEFGDPDDDTAASTAAAPVQAQASSSSSSSSNVSSSTAPSSPFAPSAAPSKPAAVATKFTGSTASPFGTASRNRSSIEPKGLSPDMGPDPVVKQAPTPGNFISRITLTQVVLFCTFSSMILLMLATFYVVLNSGAVRLAGIE